MKTLFKNVYVPDFDNDKFFKTNVAITGDEITSISSSEEKADAVYDFNKYYLIPGFIDCHTHIESSHLAPFVYGDIVARQGTLHVITDNHEIANVGGMEALQYFFNDAKKSRCNIKFAVPSCVPATFFATSGATLTVENICSLLKRPDVVSLGELMNVPAVVGGDSTFIQMIKKAKKLKKIVNGHAPGIKSEDLRKYVAAGVTDDHESETYEEIKEKIEAGLNVFLREGSAEHTQSNAYKLIDEYPDKIMFCTDDKTLTHIMDNGHIVYNVNKALDLGVKPINAIRASSYNGLTYYGMKEYSEIKPGNKASFIICRINTAVNIEEIYIKGNRLDTNIENKIRTNPPLLLQNSMNIDKQHKVPEIVSDKLCIKVNDGSLITEKINTDFNVFDTSKDILKLCVFERYGNGYKSACKINGFGINKGAIASSIAHDCHNIVAVGTSDKYILEVVNSIIENKGGLAAFDGKNLKILPLEIGGLITNTEYKIHYNKLKEIYKMIQEMGTNLTDPFGTLSFMALEVIPHIKLTDKGLFDVNSFSFIKKKSRLN